MCCVLAVVVGLIITQRGGVGCNEVSDRLQLNLSCDLLHGAMVLLADCQPSLLVVMRWEMRPG